jgi:hypothetical protein
MDSLEEELQKRIELYEKKQRERENMILENTNSFHTLVLLVSGEYTSEETKLKALKKIQKLYSKEMYEYALKKYRQKS